MHFFWKKTAKYFAGFRKVHTFALAKTPITVAQNNLMVQSKKHNAEIAQLVEHNLAKVGVAGPSPVFRSYFFEDNIKLYLY